MRKDPMLLNDLSLNLSPERLSENPQLAPLLVLRMLIYVTSLSLTAAHPEVGEDEALFDPKNHSPLPAYAAAILHQISALEETLNCYSQALEQKRIWLRNDNLPDDIPF